MADLIFPLLPDHTGTGEVSSISTKPVLSDRLLQLSIYALFRAGSRAAVRNVPKTIRSRIFCAIIIKRNSNVALHSALRRNNFFGVDAIFFAKRQRAHSTC
jgi:hypothetical protein